jgi:hypothetical protein
MDTRKSRFGSGFDVDFGGRGDLGSRKDVSAALSYSLSSEPKKTCQSLLRAVEPISELMGAAIVLLEGMGTAIVLLEGMEARIGRDVGSSGDPRRDVGSCDKM